MTYIFVVDTDAYAGNFEREMTAFVTGVIGDCGRGQEEADLFAKAVSEEVQDSFQNLMAQVPDDHGCCRPTSIYETPGFLNDGLGGHYREGEADSPEVIARYRKEMKKQLPDRKAEKAKPGNYPAYQSVAMFMNDRPDEKQVAFLISRVEAFCSQVNSKKTGVRRPGLYCGPVHVLGYRLLQERTVTDELQTW